MNASPIETNGTQPAPAAIGSPTAAAAAISRTEPTQAAAPARPVDRANDDCRLRRSQGHHTSEAPVPHQLHGGGPEPEREKTVVGDGLAAALEVTEDE